MKGQRAPLPLKLAHGIRGRGVTMRLLTIALAALLLATGLASLAPVASAQSDETCPEVRAPLPSGRTLYLEEDCTVTCDHSSNLAPCLGRAGRLIAMRRIV